MTTLEDLLRCARRELALRERTYPKLIAQGRMDERVAEHEIACMKAIVELLVERQPGLFTQGKREGAS